MPQGPGTPIRWLHGLRILMTIYLVAASLGGVFLLGVLAAQLVTGYSMPISFEISQTIGDSTNLPRGLQLTGASEILINDPTLGQTTLWAASSAVPVAVGMMVAGTLTRVVQTAIARDPFGDKNLRRVRMIGFVLLFGGLAATLVSILTNWMIARISLGDGAGSPMINELPIISLAGVVVLAIAEVMRQGAALQAELAEVV